MRKLLLTIVVLMSFMTASAKDYKMYLSINDEKISDASYENDSVRIDFIFMGCDYPYIGVRVTNKTKSRIYIEWENARLGTLNVMFMTDNVLMYSRPKQDEVVHAGSSVRRNIGIRTDGSYVMPVFRDKDVRSMGFDFTSAIIPIRYQSGKIDDIDVTIYIEYKKGAGT